MRMTKHAGHYNGNEHALQLSIRSQFKANMLETDEKKIAAMKSEAIRALSNYFVYQAKLMVGTEAPKSIYEGDDDDEEEVDRTSFLQPKPPTGVPDAEVQAPPKKRLTAAERRKNVLRAQQQLAAKRKRFMDGFNSFAAKQKEAMEQYHKQQQKQQQQQQEQDEQDTTPSEKKESGGVM